MSEYDNVVVEKLRLKGKAALGVKGDGIRKKKKQKQKQKKRIDGFSQLVREDDHDLSGRNITSLVDCSKEKVRDTHGGGGKGLYEDMLTAAERRYLQQWEKIDLQRMSKMASKSHRDRIQEFNQRLANLSEHHDIPKVGPG
ncbi:hypothetical protein IC582_007151 [Cucumis melo]